MFSMGLNITMYAKEQLAKANCCLQGDTEKTTLNEFWLKAYLHY